MSKAILVMDMPKNCEGCRFSTIGCQDNDICYLNNKEIYLGRKPDWCPLREVPQKKDSNEYLGTDELYAVGYNDCIDEIMKGSEENG